MNSMFKSETRKFLEREDIKLNDVPSLLHYLSSRFDKSTYGIDKMYKRPEIVSYLDRRIEDLKSAKYKELIECTGDADFARSRKRMGIYQDLIQNHNFKMRIMMNIESWTLDNAERLHNVGVEVGSVAPPYELHAGVLGRMLMFTLHKQPAPGAQKVVGKPQASEDVEYLMLATNNIDFVAYTQEFLEDLWKKRTPYLEIKEEQEAFSHNIKSLKELDKVSRSTLPSPTKI